MYNSVTLPSRESKSDKRKEKNVGNPSHIITDEGKRNQKTIARM